MSPYIYPLFSFWAILASVFLFWRAARHELLDSKDAFDLIGVGALGAVIGARLFDFLFKSDPTSWSLAQLVFFNRYGSFDFWGALLGMIISFFIFLRSKKTSVFFALDLVAAPLVFAQMVISLGSWLDETGVSISSPALWQFVFYLLLFVILKRLAAKKRHVGFFFCLYLVFMALFEMVLYKFKPNWHFLGTVPYEFAAPAAFFVGASSVWYLLAKRDMRQDIKNFFGFWLLAFFRTIRIIKSVEEAGTLSKSIIFVPYYIVRLLARILLKLVKEIRQATIEFLYVFGIRRFLR